MIDGYLISLDNVHDLLNFTKETNTFINLDFAHTIMNNLNLKETILLLNPKIKNIHICGVNKMQKMPFEQSEIPVLDYLKFLNLSNIDKILQ